MFGGSNHYINQEVTVHSRVNAETPVQIGSFRLIDISTDGDKISLTMTAHRPWDFITFPQTKTTDSKVPVPVSYGAFTASSNSYYDDTVSSHDLTDTLFDHELTNTDVRPCPLNNATDNNIFFVSDLTAKADSRAEHWDSGLQKFLPINDEDDSAITTSVSNDGQYCTKSEIELKRAIKLRPSTVTVSANDDSITNSDLADIVDSDGDWLTSYATLGSYTASESVDYIDLEFTDIQVPQGEITQAKLYVTSELTENSGSGGQHLRMKTSVDGSSFSTLWTQIGYHVNPGSAWQTRAKTTDSTAISSFPSSLKIRAEWSGPGAGNTMRGTFRIYNVMIVAEYKSRDDQTKTVYIGADGLVNSWDSSAISYGHEAHRDMLIRYTGYTTTAPANWSALDTDRTRNTADDGDIATWKIRWWALEPVELKKLLEQMQYEFGFIFKFRADGTGSYVHILQTSELSAVQTFKKEDIANLKINNSSFSDLLTKMEINYEKHPAENRYLSSVTSTNSTARTSWSIQAKENIQEVNLDMNVGTPNSSGQSDPNTDFYSYYDNIFGDIKKVISCDIVNPAVSYDLETGDIIQFSNTAGEMPVEPFGDNWADYYMITDLQRSPGKIRIQAREVG